MSTEKLWRLTPLNKNETLGLFLSHDDAKRFVAKKNLDEYEIYPCTVTLKAIPDTGLENKFDAPKINAADEN